LSKFVVACSDLLEAEGRTLRRESVRVGLLLVFAFVAGITALAGVMLLMFGLFLALSGPMGEAGAAIVLGLLIIALSGGTAWFIHRQAE
jgi:hypothetical protein